MILLKAQNEFDVNFQDQIILESYPISETNSNIFLNLEYAFKTKQGIIKTQHNAIEIYDENVDEIDIDFIDKEYIIVDPAWEDCPENFDLNNVATWPEGMVYPEIPKIIKPEYVAKCKYFSRLYDIIISCNSVDEIESNIFQFISIDEPQFLEQIVGADNLTKWNTETIKISDTDKDLDTLKVQKIKVLKSLVSNRLLEKNSLIKQINYLSDSFYGVKTLSDYLNMGETEIVNTISSMIGASNNISDLKKVDVADLDFSYFHKKLPGDKDIDQETVSDWLDIVARSILRYRQTTAMRIWYKQKENEIVGAKSTEEVVKTMHKMKVPEL